MSKQYLFFARKEMKKYEPYKSIFLKQPEVEKSVDEIFNYFGIENLLEESDHDKFLVIFIEIKDFKSIFPKANSDELYNIIYGLIKEGIICGDGNEKLFFELNAKFIEEKDKATKSEVKEKYGIK